MIDDYLRDIGFEPCKIEPEIRTRPCREDYYEHIIFYIDYLLIDSKDPKWKIVILIHKHSFKLKGTEPIYYNLGCDFGRDDDSTLQFAHKSA